MRRQRHVQPPRRHPQDADERHNRYALPAERSLPGFLELKSGAQGLHAQVVLAPDAASDVGERLRESLIAAVSATGAVPPVVDVQPVPTLQRQPGGKLRLVRSA